MLGPRSLPSRPLRSAGASQTITDTRAEDPRDERRVTVAVSVVGERPRQ